MSKKKRMSMLDSLAAAATPPAPTAMQANKALRSARDAVDGHSVWDLDPRQIDDSARPEDRLDINDVADLMDAIEQNGQTVPILVRRHPTEEDRYLLVYGRRRLEAIRQSDKVEKVRALIANMDERSAIQAQISENMARRDLSYIEKALFAKELVDSGFGTQAQVAEVLTVVKSSISMALTIVEMVGPDVIRAIGPAEGIGRPRWETLGKMRERVQIGSADLIDLAERTHGHAQLAPLEGAAPVDPSVAAFDAVFDLLEGRIPQDTPAKAPPARKPKGRSVRVAGRSGGTISRTPTGVRLDIDKGAFADWLEVETDDAIRILYAHWQERTQN